MSRSTDPCPTHPPCSFCDVPLCEECGGERDPWPCVSTGWDWHCGSCVFRCSVCVEHYDGAGAAS